MTSDDAVDLVRTVIHEIAPEADLEAVEPGETLQEALDMDSIDFLNFVIGLHDRTGIEIPERDYPGLATLDGCIDYLQARA
ncbi:MAG TPA: phosphopantetheine-binding protein [Acidimicrobiales bacterium]|nr:phosphopantetheine-binding protein [Acidimicrobiales bacterium]